MDRPAEPAMYLCESCRWSFEKWADQNFDVCKGNPLAIMLTSNRFGKEKDGDIWRQRDETGNAYYRESIK